MTVKTLLKKLFKECEHSAEIVIRVKDDKLIGILNLPIQLADIKQEEVDGKKIVVIDMT